MSVNLFSVVVAVICGMALIYPLLAPLRVNIERPAAAAPAPELLALPLIIEGSVFLSPYRTAVLVIGLCVYMAIRERLAHGSIALVVVATAAVFVLPFSRPYGEVPVYTSLLLPVLYLTVIVMSARRRNFHAFVTSLLDGVGIYLLLNVVAWAAGVTSPGAAVRTGALEAVGGGDRIFFPISTGLATPPAMAAIYVAASMLCLERASVARLTFRLAAFAAAGFILVGASTRASIVVGALLLATGIVSTKFLARAATLTTAGSVTFVFVFESLRTAVAVVLGFLVGLVPGFSRGGMGADLTLNFRSIIWRRTLHWWRDHADMIGAGLIGYGQNGQRQSGVSSVYARDIASISSDPRAASVHNSYLQQLFDGGLIGLAIFTALLIWTAARAARMLRYGAAGAQVAVPALLAAVVGGITEVSAAPGYGLGPVYITAAIVVAVAARGPTRVHRTPVRAGLPLRESKVRSDRGSSVPSSRTL